MLKFILNLSILFGLVGLCSTSETGGSTGQPQVYTLDLESREETNYYKYVKGSLDGLESHMLYTKENCTATKVKDSSVELWDGGNGGDYCLGAILTYKGGNKSLLVLLLRRSSTTDPLDGKVYKFENNEWKEIDKKGYCDELKKLSPTVDNPQYKDVDLESTNPPAGIAKVSDANTDFTVDLYLPNDGYRISKIVEGNNTVWERDTSKDEYALNIVTARNDGSKKVVVMATKNSDGYLEMYYVYENNEWKCVQFDEFKKYVIKAVATAKFSGALRGLLGGNGKGKNGKNGNGNGNGKKNGNGNGNGNGKSKNGKKNGNGNGNGNGNSQRMAELEID